LELTPEQDRAVGRVQLVGVLVLISLTMGVKILNYADVLGAWTLIELFIVGSVGLLVGFTVLVARIADCPVREVARFGVRNIRDDARKFVARVRRGLERLR
jgi:uncharacterized protein with ACT and thioredoxin-like domain